MHRLRLALILIGLPGAASAWTGEAGLGYLAADGNAQTSSLNAKFALDHASEGWKNHFAASAVNASDRGATSAERYTAGNQFNLDFGGRHYGFAALEFEKDLFGGIRERTSESLGYGYHLLVGPTHVLDLEAGAGARQSVEQATGDKSDDLIGRGSVRYQWTISETSMLKQSLKLESGASNTFLESVSELSLNIVGNLFAALSYTLKQNSEVPAGTENTDTFTSVNLSYKFGDQP